jgi:saccharopine dehydrogenase-like NADP-dependent oxidoreductase
MERLMSNEKLIRMYSEELEYLCGKFRNHHIYCYPKDELYRSSSGVSPVFHQTIGYEWFAKFIECEVDLGLLLVHVVEKPGDDICSPKAWTETNRYVVLRFPKVSRKKQKENELDHKFEVYRLSNVSAISMYVGTEE